MPKKKLHEGLEQWLASVCRRDIDQTVSCYAEDAVLLGTLSPILRQGHEAIRGYFDEFLGKESLEAEVTQEVVHEIDDVTIVSGLYRFSLAQDQETATVPARFTFIFQRVESCWRIVAHHSSRVP